MHMIQAASSVFGDVDSLVLDDSCARFRDIFHRFFTLESPIEETANGIFTIVSSAAIELFLNMSFFPWSLALPISLLMMLTRFLSFDCSTS